MAKISLNFAGFDLLLEDPEGRASAYIRRYLEWPHSQINGPARTIDSKSRVQHPKWPAVPRLLPNQLYWPTGATRWSRFYGLTDATTAAAIVAAMGRTTVGTLSIGVTDQVVVTTTGNTIDGSTFNLQAPIAVPMYLLTPVPVTNNGESLWIIPLVDARFYWQSASFVSAAATWTGLQTEIETSLGLSSPITRDTAAALDTNYGIPDACIFRNGIINTAAALDLYCWATNQRLVTLFSPGNAAPSHYVLRSATTAPSLYTAERDAQLNSAVSGGSAAGGDFKSATKNGDVPQIIDFHFTNDSKTSLLDYSAGTAVAWAAGSTLDLMCTATATSSNHTTLEAMADRWANDFWQWSKWRFSWGWNRILDWHFTGYEDYVLYDLSRNREGQYSARTFVKSLPPMCIADFVPMQISSGGNSCGGGGTIIIFSLVTVDCIDRVATATVLGYTCGAGTPAIGSTVELCDALRCFLVGDPGSLPGRMGLAQEMTVTQSIGCNVFYDSDPCPWVITWLVPADFSCT